MNKYLLEYRLTVTIPSGKELIGYPEGDNLEQVKDRFQRLFTFDYEEGAWIGGTFLPEDVIKNSIFTVEKI